MRSRILKKSLALFLSALMAFAFLPIVAGAAGTYTPTGDFYKISETEHRIAPGVTENRVIVNKASGTQQEMVYAVTVDTSRSTTGFLAGYADYNGSRWKMQTVRDQAAAAAAATGKNIVVAVNADIFNMSTGEPGGVLVMGGNVYRKGLGRSYFGVTKSGGVVIGESLTQAVLDTLQDAVSGFYMIVKNGQRYGQGKVHDSNVAPKTCVGIKADGSVVIVTIDGRNYPISCSLDDYDLATIMMDLGCVDVLNLDGGGSSTYLAKYEGSGYLTLANNPSDAVERKVSSTLFVTSSATPSGVFDHASLSPNNDVYTPGSTVTFSALGVDSSGAAAPLPADGEFRLDDACAGAGSITADGVFTANETTGTVTVNYVSGGSVTGSTSIEVRHPDEIYFSDDEISLGFEDESDLGLVVKYLDRDVIIKDGDIVWSTTFNTPTEGDKFEYNGAKIIWHNNDFYYYTASGTTISYGSVVPESERAGFYAEILGTFSGNTFTSAAGNSVNGVITATYAKDTAIHDSINAIIGRLPVVIEDFEGELIFGRVGFNANGGILRWDNEVPGCNMLTGHYYNGDGSSRGGQESAETVDVDSGEPVRFGNQSLKLNYDFTNINGIEGACVGFTAESEPIPGNPTGIGMWVYSPEGGRNFWLRIRLLDGMNNILTLDFTKQKEGINWTGWKYVECDLTKHQGPFKLMGGETIRLMHTYGAYDGMGNYLAGTVTTAGPDANSVFLGQATCKGSVYVDNLQFVYGANIDDIDNPIINSMSVNNEDLVDGKTVVNTADISLNAYVSDTQNKYTTGVDYDVLRIYVDGVNHTYDKYEDGTDACVITEGDGRIDLYNLHLADGDHCVTVLVRDKFGNETSETRYFTVDTGNTSGIPGMRLTPVSEPVLGQEFALALTADNAAAVTQATATIKIDAAFKDYRVVYADGFTGTDSFNAFSNEITLDVTRTGSAAEGTLATVYFPIAADTAKGTQFTYSVASGAYVNDDGSGGSFACTPQYLDISAYYTVEASAAVVGYDAVITVTDRDGAPAAGVNVYRKQGAETVLLGVTGSDGTLTTAALTGAVAAYSIYAEKDGLVSFVYTSQSVAPTGSADGRPYSLMINAAADSETQKNFTWLSNPGAASGSAVVQYALKADYDANGEDAFITAQGNAKLVDFLGSADVNNNYGVFLNTVVLTGLQRDTDYVYRAGDGTLYSPVYEFSTLRRGADVNFFIIGDTQTAEGEIENIQAVLGNLGSDGVDYDFGTQLGDFVEKGNMYADWADILAAYDVDALKNTDQIHVIGNHESFGYPAGTPTEDIFASSLYNVPDADCYSAIYGNVYVAVINYTNNEAVLQRCIDWLKQDAAGTTAQWKILLTHQPAYGTNAATFDTSHFHSMLPPVLEELGFDFMFSGHDHAFARTKPLTGGEVDEENGVVYYVCASTGEKSYTATNNPEYHFDVCTQDYDHGLYLTVEATDKEFTITTRESDGTVYDVYTKKAKGNCAENGHTYVYDDDGYLVCTVCRHTESLGTYTGFAEDAATGRTRYFVNGQTQTGWLNYEDDCYYFDENGLAVGAGSRTIDGVPYTFDDDGKQIGYVFYEVEDGFIRCYRGGSYLTSWNEIDGKTYFFSTNRDHEGKMMTGRTAIHIYTGQVITYNFAEDGHLLDYVWVEDQEGTRYYWAQDPVTGWQTINGNRYYFDPATALMAVGNVEIDGVVYGFSDEGILMHEGPHDLSYSHHTTLGCTTHEADVYVCSICGCTVSEIQTRAPGHVDEDNDGLCDVCGVAYEYDGYYLEWVARIFLFLRYVLNYFVSLLEKFQAMLTGLTG